MRINTKQYKTKNFKGVLSLLAGNTVSKAILTLGGLVLVNYYGPENYAVYNVFLSYVMILPVLASFRLENIMILQKGSSEIRNLFTGTIWLSAIGIILLIGVLTLIKQLNLFDLGINYFILGLCGIGAILTGWNNTQNSLFTKFKLFKQLSTAIVLSSVFSVIFQFIFYFTQWQENGLVYGWIIGLLASFIFNARITKDRLANIDIPLFKKSLREHFEVVKFTYPSDSINIIANYIFPILAIAYFSKPEVGIFALAFKILTTPLVLISASVSRVYFQKSVSLFHHDKIQLEKLTHRVIFSNLGFMILFLILINTLGIYILNLYLKEEWSGLGHYILLLSFWILARSALNPIISILMIIKKNHYSLIFNIYLLAVNFIAIYCGVLENDFKFGILIFSIFSGIGYMILTIVILLYLSKIKKMIV